VNHESSRLLIVPDSPVNSGGKLQELRYSEDLRAELGFEGGVLAYTNGTRDFAYTTSDEGMFQQWLLGATTHIRNRERTMDMLRCVEV
jgi:hypothetical protein